MYSLSSLETAYFSHSQMLLSLIFLPKSLIHFLGGVRVLTKQTQYVLVVIGDGRPPAPHALSMLLPRPGQLPLP